MHTCPNCGYCPSCGRSNQPVYPAPMYPGKPIWVAPPYGAPGTARWDVLPGPIYTTQNDSTSPTNNYC
jgi:hypothetical protein